MKNVVFWDIKPHFVLNRRTLLLRYRAQCVFSSLDVRDQVPYASETRGHVPASTSLSFGIY
jgi:hypothetical protein